MLRTTCVATRLSAGHANMLWPQRAQAIVNCRILPGHSPAETERVLVRMFADPQVSVRYVGEIGRYGPRAGIERFFPPCRRRRKCWRRCSGWRRKCGRAPP